MWIGAAFVILLIVPILAVTLLGKSSTSKFSSITTAIGDPITTTTAPVWSTWSPPDNSFSVDLPSVPKEMPLGLLPAGVVSAHLFNAESNAGYRGYAVQWMDLEPGLVFDTDKGLQGMAEGAAKGGNGTLVSSELGQFAGMRSIAFSLKLPAFSGRGVGFMAGKRLYAFYVIAKIPAPPDELQRVLDSLKLGG